MDQLDQDPNPNPNLFQILKIYKNEALLKKGGASATQARGFVKYLLQIN